MISVLFPGQGSQSVGMIKNLYDNFGYIKDLFVQADDVLNLSLSKIIFEGPIDLLNETENTQPAIFLVSYSIFKMIKNETSFEIDKANFFAGHSLGEYSALACSNVINFEETIKLLKIRGQAMQNAVPKNEGGMIAVLGENINKIKDMINDNKEEFECYLANDNSNGQVVISGKKNNLEKFEVELSKSKIKNVRLPVSAPFHCILMKTATQIMTKELRDIKFSTPNNKIVSNVTALPSKDPEAIKNLLLEQIEKPVRWRESIIYMEKAGVKNFVEIGPGKALVGMVKRTIKNANCFSINSITDIKNLIHELKK